MKRRQHRIGSKAAGFTLVEVAIVLVTIGLLIRASRRGQELIQNARVRDIIADQDAIEQACLGVPGPVPCATGRLRRSQREHRMRPGRCPNGNGNGRVAGTDGAIHEDILAWQHLTASGFLRGDYRMLPGVTVPSADNCPTSVFGGYLQIAFDNTWGANTASGHNIKTGNYVPAAVLADVDRKIDDGLSAAGRFQFSTYAGAGSPPVGGTAGGCVSPIRLRVPGCSQATTVVLRFCCVDDLHSRHRISSRKSTRQDGHRRHSYHCLDPRGPRGGSSDRYGARQGYYYQVDFVDSAANVLSVLRLSEEALLSLAGTSCVLAEEVERRRGEPAGASTPA